MTDYGDNTYYNVLLSTAESSGEPSGDVVYFLCSKVQGNFKSQNKNKKYAGGLSFSDKTGKRDEGMSLTNIVIRPYSTYTLTQSFNNIKNFLKARTKISQSPCYIWVHNSNDDDYVSLGSNSSMSSFTDYMKGYPMDFTWSLEKNVYKIPSLNFDECLN